MAATTTTPTTCPPPPDNVAFWASLDKKQGGTSQVVRAKAFHPYVDTDSFDSFLHSIDGNIRLCKMLTNSDTGVQEMYVLLARAQKSFPDLPWPKKCAGPCGQDKPYQRFPKTCTKCYDCGGSARVKTEESRARDAARKADSRAKKRARRS